MSGYIIEVENLVKKFNDLVAVNDINFKVEPGEIFGFLGPNGAGKTTTINILCTLLKPTSGRAIINGFDVAHQQSQVRQSIGLVFQDPSLDERLSGLQNLRFHAMVYNVPASVREARIEQMLRMMELWDKRHSQVRTYSGGMKRRLELARGLLHYPKVLFLDEPTLGLDPQTRHRIWEYILQLRQSEKTTVFLTTHYMDEAGIANRIAIIDRGRIIALDSPRKLQAMVAKDIITVTTDNDAEALKEIELRYQIEARHGSNGLTFEVPNGEQFLPDFIREFGHKILSVNLRRPSLDDVFLKLTGREMREEEAKGTISTIARQHGRRMRH